jgi:hypothetical protein
MADDIQQGSFTQQDPVAQLLHQSLPKSFLQQLVCLHATAGASHDCHFDARS